MTSCTCWLLYFYIFFFFFFKTIGKAPTRAYHSCNRFYDELLIFGGVYPNPDPTPDGCSNELIIFDIGTEKVQFCIVFNSQTWKILFFSVFNINIFLSIMFVWPITGYISVATTPGNFWNSIYSWNILVLSSWKLLQKIFFFVKIYLITLL